MRLWLRLGVYNGPAGTQNDNDDDDDVSCLVSFVDVSSKLHIAF